MTSTELAPTTNSSAMVLHYNQAESELIRRTIAPGVTPDQFQLFMAIATRTGLDPLAKQIYPVPYSKRVKVNGQWTNSVEMTVITGIDGYRAIAQRSGKYGGSGKPQWCGKDMIWRDVWLEEDDKGNIVPPAACTVTVYRDGDAYTHTVTYREFVQTVPIYEGEGQNRRQVGKKPNSMWESMPSNQLAKCAEAGALRKAFPVEMGGVFVDAEEAAIGYVVDVENQRQELGNPNTRAITPPQRASEKAKAAPRRSQPHEKPFGTEDDDDTIDAEFHVEEGPDEQGPADQPAPAAGGDAPWGQFYNAWQDKYPLVSIGEIAAALELKKPNVTEFKAWYESAGASMDLIDYVADKVAAGKGS